MSPLPIPYPKINVDDDYNPAIRLFGKRFISEQSALELLAEFMAVVLCEKRIGGSAPVCDPLPSLTDLRQLGEGQPLHYRPPIKLNLKLFGLLTASRVDTRHDAHHEQYRRLVSLLTTKIRTNEGDPEAPVEWFEDLLRGFQGAGFNRAWCAQTFFPVSSSLLAQETLWNESVARREPVTSWADAVRQFHKYFSVSRHRFLARGGEVLYLQLCNALTVDGQRAGQFIEALRAAHREGLSDEETDLGRLRTSLGLGLARLKGNHTAAFDRLLDTIENLDPQTTRAIQASEERDGGWLTCGWCPQDSWKEGYLFAVELNRVLGASLDPVDRLELLITGCALQVLRSLCAQSARYIDSAASGSPLGYAWLFTPLEGASRQTRLASQRNLQTVQGLIQRALRIDELRRNAAGHPQKTEQALYREADTQYGHKLFLSLGKKLGLITPRRGPGARLVMTDGVLRYLVLALLRPHERCTYEDFLRRLYLHYGIAVEGDALASAAEWSGLPVNSSIQPRGESWLAASLRAGGFLTELSDACSIVRNTYGAAGSQGTGVFS